MKKVTLVSMAVFCILVSGCGNSSSSSTGSGSSEDTTGQHWSLTFEDSLHPQTITVFIAPFSTSSTWGETGSSDLLWMFDTSGNKCFNMLVGGNSFHDSPGDRFDCVNLHGSGCGMQTIGSCSFTINGNFPNATTIVSGSYTLTTTSPLGTVKGTQSLTGHRL